jgi:hypothetical protein
LAIETETDDDIIKQMKESAAGPVKFKEDEKGYVGIFYDNKLAGEASAQPHIRHPPLRDNGDHWTRLANLRLRALGESEIPLRGLETGLPAPGGERISKFSEGP